MAINNHSQYHERGAIRSETNVNGQWIDAEEAVALKNHQEHSFTENVPWSQSYQPEPIYVEPSTPIEPDPALEAAQRKDLRIRNIPLTDS